MHYEIGDITRGSCIHGDVMGTAREGGAEAKRKISSLCTVPS